MCLFEIYKRCIEQHRPRFFFHANDTVKPINFDAYSKSCKIRDASTDKVLHEVNINLCVTDNKLNHPKLILEKPESYVTPLTPAFVYVLPKKNRDSLYVTYVTMYNRGFRKRFCLPGVMKSADVSFVVMEFSLLNCQESGSLLTLNCQESSSSLTQLCRVYFSGSSSWKNVSDLVMLDKRVVIYVESGSHLTFPMSNPRIPFLEWLYENENLRCICSECEEDWVKFCGDYDVGIHALMRQPFFDHIVQEDKHRLCCW